MQDKQRATEVPRKHWSEREQKNWSRRTMERSVGNIRSTRRCLGWGGIKVAEGSTFILPGIYTGKYHIKVLAVMETCPK